MAGSQAAVAAELNALSATGGELDTNAAHCTDTRYASDPGRRRFRKQIVKKYLALHSPLVGRLAIVTAGPPGSGKTTLLSSQVPTLMDYRILDADIIKDDLIDEALSAGIYNHLLSRKLADGHCISPRELAPLVHKESVRVIGQIRQSCVADGENVVIEGTLSYPGTERKIYRQLAKSKYTSVEVFGVEIGQAAAHAQALSRWWGGRQLWISGTDRLGGRFMPPGYISMCYSGTVHSVCSANALDMIKHARSGRIASLRVRIFGRDANGGTIQLSSATYP
jgi:predicted kinase